MSTGQRSGRLSVVQACAFDDKLMTPALCRMLGLLGTYSDEMGWCYPKQETLAARAGMARENINRQIHDLVRLGYLRVVHQYRDDGGQRGNAYKILLDFELPRERYRVAPPIPDETPPATSEITPPVTPSITPPVTPSITPPVTPSITPKTTLSERLSLERHISSARAEHVNGSREPKQERPANPYALMRQHVLWQAFASFLPQPETIAEEGRWAKAVRALDGAGATPDELRRRVIRFRQKWPRAAITPTGIANTWSQLAKGESSNGYDVIAARLAEQRATDEAARLEEFQRRSRDLVAQLDE